MKGLAHNSTVSTRGFLRDYKKIAYAKNETVVMNRGKTVGVFVPVDLWEEKYKDQSAKKYDVNKLKKYFIKADSDLSSQVDSIYS